MTRVCTDFAFKNASLGFNFARNKIVPVFNCKAANITIETSKVRAALSKREPDLYMFQKAKKKPGLRGSRKKKK